MAGQALTIGGVTRDYAAWQAANEVAWCHRMCATISAAACLANMYKSEGKESDCRCAGCGGLHDQPEPQPRPIVEDEAPAPAPIVEQAPLSRAFAAMLQEILLGQYDASANDPDDEEPDDEAQSVSLPEPVEAAVFDPFTELLLADLQGLNEEEEEEDCPHTTRVAIDEQPERKRRVWVFTGRCPRCRGYMLHSAKECHDGVVDDAVYRCFTCGFRISPAYDYNRKNPGEGWR